MEIKKTCEVIKMKIVEAEHAGVLAVTYSIGYEHTSKQEIGKVHPGQIIIIMKDTEFQRFKKVLS